MPSMKNDIARLGANYSTSASGSGKHYYRTSWQTNGSWPAISFSTNSTVYTASSTLGTYANVYSQFMHMPSPGFFNKLDYTPSSTVSRIPGISTYSAIPVSPGQMRLTYLNDIRVKHYAGGSLIQELNTHIPYRGYDVGFVRVVDVPPGVKELSFMLVGAGGGGTYADGSGIGAVGGTGNFLSGKIDISGTAQRWRRYVMIAGTPGYPGLYGTWVEGGMGGNSGELFPVDNTILNYPEANGMTAYSSFMKTHAVSYKRRENPFMTRPAAVNSSFWDSIFTSITANGQARDVTTFGLAQMNHRFIFYIPYNTDSDLSGYTISFEGDDLITLQMFDPITGSNPGTFGSTSVHNPVLDQALDFSSLPNAKHNTGGDGKYLLIGLNVYVQNANSPYPSFNPCMFAIVIKNPSGSIIWTTRDNYATGIGAISAFGKGAAGGTSGFVDTSASGGGGGGASYLLEVNDIESTGHDSVTFSVLALAGGGGGAGGAGSNGSYHPGNETLRGFSQDFAASIGASATSFKRAVEGFSVNTGGFSSFTDDAYGNAIPAGADDGGGAGGGGGGAGFGGAVGGYGDHSAFGGSNGFNYAKPGVTTIGAMTQSVEVIGLTSGDYATPTTSLRSVVNLYFPDTSTLMFPATGTDVSGTYTQNNMGMGGYSQVGAQLPSPGKPGFCYLEWGAPN